MKLAAWIVIDGNIGATKSSVIKQFLAGSKFKSQTLEIKGDKRGREGEGKGREGVFVCPLACLPTCLPACLPAPPACFAYLPAYLARLRDETRLRRDLDEPQTSPRRALGES